MDLKENSKATWLPFIIYAFILNMIKLFGFSLTFVLLMLFYSKYFSLHLASAFLKSEDYLSQKTEQRFEKLKLYLIEKKKDFFDNKANKTEENNNDKK